MPPFALDAASVSRPRWHGRRRGARFLVSADRPRHVDFFVRNWAHGGIYVQAARVGLVPGTSVPPYPAGPTTR